MTETAPTKRQLVIKLRDDDSLEINHEGVSTIEVTAMIVSAYRLEMARHDRSWGKALDRALAAEPAALDGGADG